MRRSPTLALVALALLAMSGPSHAQQLEGAVHLATGFIPDPAVLEGRTTGARPASSLAETCTGFVGGSPSHVIALDTRFGYLRFFATSSTDLVLAVKTASGEWLCSDDRFGTHPSVEGLFQRGRVELWIGTQQAGASAEYVLRVTETRSIRPGIGAEPASGEAEALARDLGLEVEATEGLFEPIRMRRGFLPDPRWLTGTAGGALDASAVGGSCRGYVTPTPTHVITLQIPFDFLQLYLDESPTREQEVTLIVLTPDGRFLCDVGTREVPDVSADAWPEGVYRVWVGTLEEGSSRGHRLGISEIRRAR